MFLVSAFAKKISHSYFKLRFFSEKTVANFHCFFIIINYFKNLFHFILNFCVLLGNLYFLRYFLHSLRSLRHFFSFSFIQKSFLYLINF